MEIISFIVGIVVGIIGGIMAYNGWIKDPKDPKDLGLIVPGVILVIVGLLLSGWVIILGLDLSRIF